MGKSNQSECVLDQEHSSDKGPIKDENWTKPTNQRYDEIANSTEGADFKYSFKMAEVVVESVSKLELLEANYENTKLLVNQETLKCQKWKQTIDLLLQEEKLHEKSLDVRRLRRTVEEKHHELEVSFSSLSSVYCGYFAAIWSILFEDTLSTD